MALPEARTDTIGPILPRVFFVRAVGVVGAGRENKAFSIVAERRSHQTRGISRPIKADKVRSGSASIGLAAGPIIGECGKSQARPLFAARDERYFRPPLSIMIFSRFGGFNRGIPRGRSTLSFRRLALQAKTSHFRLEKPVSRRDARPYQAAFRLRRPGGNRIIETCIGRRWD